MRDVACTVFAPCFGGADLTKLLVTCCTFVLSSLGWYAGERFGIFTAFVCAVVGTGVGVYVGKQLADRWGM